MGNTGVTGMYGLDVLGEMVQMQALQYKFCDPEQISFPVLASVPSSVKWE